MNINGFSVGKQDLRAIIFICMLISLITSTLIILWDSGIVPPHPMDQSFAETVDLHIKNNNGKFSFAYPNLQYSGGITANLAVGVYKLIVPVTHKTLNWHVRIFSMLVYMISGFVLIFSFVRNDVAKLLGVLLLATSGFQFIQPSSELLAGAAISMFFFPQANAGPEQFHPFF